MFLANLAVIRTADEMTGRYWMMRLRYDKSMDETREV